MRGFVYALTHLLSLPRNLRGTGGLPRSVSCQRTPPALQWFRPTCELLEDRILPSTLPVGILRFGATPPAPPAYSAQAVSTSQIKLTWTAVMAATGYKVDEWVNGAWKQVAVLGSSSTSYSFTGLSANTTYSFDLASYNTIGTDFASSKSATTLKAVAPAAPTVTTTVVSSSQIKLAWNVVTGATGYLVDEWINGAWDQIASLSSSTTSYSVTGLNAGTSYSFEVAASNGAGTTWSPSKSATTTAAAPTFTTTVVSSSQINLAWTLVTGATGYLVDEWVNGTWKQIASLSSATTSYSVTGLNAGTTYKFEVAAANGSGTTWASSQSATTTAAVSINHPVADTGYSAVTGTLFGSNGPVYKDVVQGYLGDCWLLASLAEVAVRDPSIIQSMFTSEGTTVENGTTVSLYSVRFYNSSGTAFYVTVDTELPSGGGYYDHPANGVLWVALAEKAYAEANGQDLVTTGDDGSDSYNALDEGDPAWALQAITGQTSTDYSINPSSIPTAWTAGDLVVLCTYSPSSPYIVPDHCYALVGYNSASSQPFQVYNPWGTNSAGWALGTNDGQAVYGLFNATATFLSQNYAWQGFGVADENGGGSLGESLGAAEAPLSMDGAVTALAPALPTAFAVPSGETNAIMVPDQAVVSSLIATDAQASDQVTHDAIWAEGPQPDSVVGFLGEAALLFGTYVV